jgi:hypothetical protein
MKNREPGRLSQPDSGPASHRPHPENSGEGKSANVRKQAVETADIEVIYKKLF